MSALDIVGPVGSPRNVGNAEFLEWIFGVDWRSAHVTGFPTDPTLASSAEWAGNAG